MSAKSLKRVRLPPSDDEEDVPVEFVEMLCAEQAVRLARMRNEPLYLIAMEDDGSTFKVTGSTGNLYTIKIELGENPLERVPPPKLNEVIKCNCPDARMHAKRQHVLCKHGCYVMTKALRLSIEEVFIVGGISTGAIAHAVQETRGRNLGHLSNSEYSKRYSDIQTNADAGKEKYTPPPGVVITDDCAICLDAIESASVGAVCPGCRNYFHGGCIDVWMGVRLAAHLSQNCPLCRAPWHSYVPSGGDVVKKRGFINLAT